MVCVCVCVCVWFFFLLSLFVTLYLFLHLTAMYSSTFGKGWVGSCCLYFLLWVTFGSFSLQELTCMHGVYLVLWTRKVLCGSFLCIIYKFSFIHSCSGSPFLNIIEINSFWTATRIFQEHDVSQFTWYVTTLRTLLWVEWGTKHCAERFSCFA